LLHNQPVTLSTSVFPEWVEAVSLGSIVVVIGLPVGFQKQFFFYFHAFCPGFGRGSHKTLAEYDFHRLCVNALGVQE
jgi:hypothetical protein